MANVKQIGGRFNTFWNRVTEWSKSTDFPGFKDVSLYEVWHSFKRQLKEDNIFERAAAISFNFAMALPPMIIFLFTLIPFLPINKVYVHELYGIIRDIVPGQKNFAAIREFLEDFLNNPRNGLLSLGFVLSIFFSSNAMMGLMRSFDKNLPGFIKRKGLVQRWAAIKMTILLMIFFFLALTSLIAQGAVLKWIGVENLSVRKLIGVLRWVLIVFLFFVMISYIYRYAPSRDKRWKFFTPGSIIATLMLVMFALGFSWWVANFGNYNKLYGSIGTLLILLVMINFNALAVLVGFELNVSVFALQKAREAEEGRPIDDDVLL